MGSRDNLIKSFSEVKSSIVTYGSFWKKGPNGWYKCYNEDEVQEKLLDIKTEIQRLKDKSKV